jgi:glutaredoxin
MSHKRAIRFFLLCVSLSSMIAGTRAGIYKWVDGDGRVQFSDRPPPEGGAEQVELPEINTYEGVSVEDLVERLDTRSREPKRAKSRKVVMYSASWCGVCARARRFFQAEGIPFRELDIEKSQSARRDWKRMRATGVPVILVGGKRMSGFSEARFMQLYQD